MSSHFGTDPLFDAPRERRAPPADPLETYGARVLDPATASRIAGHPPVRNTAYVSDRVLLSAFAAGDETLALLDEAAHEHGLGARPVHDPPESPLDVLRVQLGPATAGPVAPPDAWEVLQTARARFGLERLRGVGLDHLLFANLGVIGAPQLGVVAAPDLDRPDAGDVLDGAHDAVAAGAPSPGGGAMQGPLAEAAHISRYAVQGHGGRQPVAWPGPAPGRRPDAEIGSRRPVVAILDSGCGRHPWLDPVVRAELTMDGAPIGHGIPLVDPEVTADLQGPVDLSVDAVAGHGTFMAGLVHVACPDAEILAVRVVHADGVALESDVVRALGQLTELVRRYHAGERGGQPVDVVVLSVGYYHEQPDAAFVPALADVIDQLGRLGTIVVASAGNDGTSRPMYPAAFAPYADGGGLFDTTADRVPLVSVGALNPDGTDALFSNAGPWVRAWTPGAALVSTMPVTFHGGIEPLPRGEAFGRARSALDPDDYRSGFAVWSGTSFSAPLLAGRMAANLAQLPDDGPRTLQRPGVPEAVSRAWEQVGLFTGMRA